MRGAPIAVSEEVEAFHREALVIDLHNDVLTKLSHVRFDFGRRHAPALFWNPLRLDLDLPKIAQGGLDALGCLLFAGFRVRRAARFWRQLDCARDLVRRFADRLALVDTAGGVAAARGSGRTALFLGVEGSYVVETDIDAHLPRLAAAGVRFLGPLWERDSLSGSSCRSRDDRGLTPLGRRLVEACEAHGILPDVAHASARTFWDIAETARGPIFTSHSGAAGVHPHPRNLDDAQLREIARRGGVVGVILVSSYLKGTFCALDAAADHIEHVARVAGEDVVALGSDFDGFMPLPRGLRDAADLPRLTQILWSRGWRESRLRKLLGENALRMFTDAWKPR
jgi:membrane dipeptidase